MIRSRVACRLGLIVVVGGLSSCAPVVQRNRPDGVTPRAPMLELWKNPDDLTQRNLQWGPGRPADAPATNAMYTVLKRDHTGYSRGYDVVGPDKRKWSIKVGKEAQSEIVLSRILWALGYHQPETYYVKGWQLAGDWQFEGEPDGATACNCTACRRYGALWAYDYEGEGIKVSGATRAIRGLNSSR